MNSNNIKTQESPSLNILENNVLKRENKLYSALSTISNRTQYKNALKKALENFDVYIQFQILDYNKNVYTLDIINEILKENPDINYGFKSINATISWIGIDTTKTMTIYIKYDKSKKEMLELKNKSVKKAKQIIKKIIYKGMNDFEKELVIHDYIVNNTRYDKADEESISFESHTDYGVLVKGTGVCDGYSKAFIRLLKMVDIECMYVLGEVDSGLHAWVMAKIDNKWMHIDITWDDPVGLKGDYISYDYFNVSDKIMEEDHTWDKNSYPKSTKIKKPMQNNTTYILKEYVFNIFSKLCDLEVGKNLFIQELVEQLVLS